MKILDENLLGVMEVTLSLLPCKVRGLQLVSSIMGYVLEAAGCSSMGMETFSASIRLQASEWIVLSLPCFKLVGQCFSGVSSFWSFRRPFFQVPLSCSGRSLLLGRIFLSIWCPVGSRGLRGLIEHITACMRAYSHTVLSAELETEMIWLCSYSMCLTATYIGFRSPVGASV